MRHSQWMPDYRASSPGTARSRGKRRRRQEEGIVKVSLRRSSQHSKIAIVLSAPVYPLRSFLEVGFTSLIDVHELLRITINQREPRTLNLHHDPVPAAKRVVNIGKREFHL